MTKESYLLDPNFDHSTFHAINKTMYLDDRIMEVEHGGTRAIDLYGAFKGQQSLSKSTTNKKYRDAKGNYYGVYPQKTAEFELRIKRTKYYKHKNVLKDAGLIGYEGQTLKKEGDASKVYVTQWEDWVKANGLYAYGEWIVQPSSPNYYNPTDIVKVQPTISAVEPVEADPADEQPEQPVLTSYEEELHAKVFVKHEMPDGIDVDVSEQPKAKTIKYVQVRRNIERNYQAVWLIEIDADRNKTENDLHKRFPNQTVDGLIANSKRLGYEIKTIEVP